jgi:hypothetical protein
LIFCIPVVLTLIWITQVRIPVMSIFGVWKDFRWTILITFSRMAVNCFDLSDILNLSSSSREESATTLVSVWNTRVFRTALTALAEPRTLWQRIRRDPSPKRWVALHTSHAAAIIPCLVFLGRVALYITLAAAVSGFLYFASGM